MTLKLNASIRSTVGKKLAELRQAGKIPAVVYGHKTENLNLEFNYTEFEKAFKSAGESTIIELVLEGKEPIKALISEVQIEPGKGRIVHADLHQINMKEKINANVPINLIGESRLVKEEGAVVIHNISDVDINCLPGDLIHEIEVDISTLNDFEDNIAIKDLKVPANVEIMNHEPEDVVVLVTRPKEEKEEEPASVVPTEGEVVVEGETPKEGEAEKK